MKSAPPVTRTKVADEVWVVVALLHKEHPKQLDFTIEQVMERAAREANGETLRPGVYVHIVQHCVANRPPNPGRYRMLFETAPGRRRLFRSGDVYDHAREGPKLDTSPADMRIRMECPLPRGLSWRLPEHADEYVRRLREGWE